MEKSALTVARYLLNRAKESDRAFSPMQLIKLVYIAHGWMLALYDRPLIRDDIEAWRYGPLMPDLFNQIKQRPLPAKSDKKLSNIEKLLLKLERVKPRAVSLDDFSDVKNGLDDDEIRIVENTVEVYGDRTAVELMRMTHQKNSPWWKIYDGGKGERDVIPNPVIKEYYDNLYESITDAT